MDFVKNLEEYLPKKWDYEADVVVVGGGTGTAAAIEAHEAGAKVIIVEKARKIGGTTEMSEGGIYAADTPLQKKLGIEDSVDEAYKYLIKVGGEDVDPELVRIMADNGPKLYEWYTEFLGLEFKTELFPFQTMRSGGLSLSDSQVLPQFKTMDPPAPRCHWPEGFGRRLMAAIEKKLDERKIPIMVETKVTELVAPLRADGGREVLGVVAETKDEKKIYIKARKAVILATNGPGSNKEIVKGLPGWTHSLSINHPSCTGDGIIMAQKLGAFLWKADGTLGILDWQIMGYWNNFETFVRIMVNKRGKRYHNEDAHFGAQGYYLSKQEDMAGWLITDESQKNVGGWGDELIGATAEVIKADTIRELAEKAGINPEGLENTIADWNKYAETGVDLEWGRQFGLGPLNTPPYYASRMVFFTGHVGGVGVKINKKAQVIDVEGKVIPRLYASGSMVGGINGGLYPGCGCALTPGFIFGWIAGRNASAEEPWD